MKQAKAAGEQLSCLLKTLSRSKIIRSKCEGQEVQFLPQNAPETAWRPGSPKPLGELATLPQSDSL